jgi:hypothetical protein
MSCSGKVGCCLKLPVVVVGGSDVVVLGPMCAVKLSMSDWLTDWLYSSANSHS